MSIYVTCNFFFALQWPFLYMCTHAKISLRYSQIQRLLDGAKFHTKKIISIYTPSSFHFQYDQTNDCLTYPPKDNDYKIWIQLKNKNKTMKELETNQKQVVLEEVNGTRIWVSILYAFILSMA